MADPFGISEGSDEGFESVSKSDLLTPEGADSTTTTPPAVVDSSSPPLLDVDLVSTDKGTGDIEITQEPAIQTEHELGMDINNGMQSISDIDNDMLGLNDPQEEAVVSGSTQEQQQDFTSPQDLLLDFGTSSTMESKIEEPSNNDLFEDDVTPTAPEQSAFSDQFEEREATPPPSPQPSPERELVKIEEKIPEPVVEPEPIVKPDPVIAPVQSAPVADSTTPSSSSDDRPMKMPKATSAPSKNPTNRTSGCSFLRDLDPRVWNVLLWRDPLVTGPILGFLLVTLLSLTCCSAFSVTSYLLLFILLGALIVRVVKYLMAKIHTGEETHPFKQILDTDVTVSEPAVQEFMEAAVPKFNHMISSVRDLLLVQDVISSLKFGLVLYAATYIGAWFNGLTLVILVTVGAFTLPKVYEVNKGQIDHYVDMAQSRFEEYYKQLQDKVPFLKKQKIQ